MRNNADMRRTVVPAKATSEHYSLFRTYIDHRHSDGGMADMTVLDFAAMVDDTLVDSRIIEYRIPTAYQPEGELIAAVLVDVLNDGCPSSTAFMIRSWKKRSLGTFIILDMIEQTRLLGIPTSTLGSGSGNPTKCATRPGLCRRNGWGLRVGYCTVNVAIKFLVFPTTQPAMLLKCAIRGQ